MRIPVGGNKDFPAPTRGQTTRYLASLDKLVMDYLFAGIPAVAPVPDYLLRSAAWPTPLYIVCFQQAGVACAHSGSFQDHQLFLAALAGNKQGG